MSDLLVAGTVRRTATALADGRELIYYDDSPEFVAGTSSRVTPASRDTRDLPAAGGGSELRWDVLTGEWVAIASHRNTRTFLPPKSECPLCPTRPGIAPSEIPASDYDVAVFENRFPSLSTRTEGAAEFLDGDPLWPTRPGIGRCDVVCFTADHGTSFASLTPARTRTVIEAWADRTADLSAISGVAQVFCFENRGQEIGQLISASHSLVSMISLIFG